MIGPRALLPLLVLAACSQAPESPDQAACERSALDDPTVKEMLMKGAGSTHYQFEQRDAIQAAKQDATLRCLRNRGLIQPGGVQRQKPLG